MTSKACWLFCLAVAVNAAAAGFSPFQYVADYVSNFESGLRELKSAATHELQREATYRPEIYNETHAASEAEEYDFIVIGSGASGSAIASRLSEVPEWKVLLLEAGAPETVMTQVPAMQRHLRNTLYNWGYKTSPQTAACLGTEGHQCSIGTGRAVGGETATNDMLYTRGDPRDYDLWADTGLIGWCWSSVKPYFKKLEDIYAEDMDRKFHHYGGPVHIENFQYSTSLLEHLLEATHELGLKKIDYNGRERIGVGIPQVTTTEGKRTSAAESYLAKAHRRKNLTIKPLSHVIKILVSHHTKEASGVKYIHAEELFIAKATKEVILSAGALNSPHILLHSGIGPKEDLERLEIPVASDLSVGHHLRDQLKFIGLNFIFNASGHDVHIEPRMGRDCQNDMMRYLKDCTGPLTTTGLELVAFLQTDASVHKIVYPDLQLLITRNIYNQGYEHLRDLGISKDIYESVWQPLEHKEGFTVEIILLHPKSNGYLKLDGHDPLHQPLINPNYLSDEDDEDIETILAGVHKALKLLHTKALEQLGVHLNRHRVPACDRYKDDDDYWKCAIRYLSVSARQVTGTAKMGDDVDKEAVVDKELRVRGVHKLRVADASVIPVTISGNVMAAEYMIGEQAADFIKRDWIKDNELL